MIQLWAGTLSARSEFAFKLKKQQRRQRQEIFQVEDSIIEKRDALVY